MSKIAIFFPGIGYTLDKPLLYYSRKLATKYGYEIRLLPYGNFPEKIQGNRERMVESFEIASKQTKEMLRDIDFSYYEEVLLVGKSIGTIVAAKVAAELQNPGKAELICNSKNKRVAKVKAVLYTPLEDTFHYNISNAIAFTGTSDPWVGGPNSRIAKICYENEIRCTSFEAANHSLETGEVTKDLEYLKLALEMTEKFLKS